MNERSNFGELQATELFCPRCRRAQPVRQHLLLVLPTGNQFDYRCAVCNTSVGSRTDDEREGFDLLRPRR